MNITKIVYQFYLFRKNFKKEKQLNIKIQDIPQFHKSNIERKPTRQKKSELMYRHRHI